MFHDQDLRYIAKKLKIPLNIARNLTEDEKDANLILSEVSVKDIKKDDLKKLTQFTYIKLVLFRYSYDAGFDINDRVYVAKCVYYLYQNIKKGLDYKLIKDIKIPSEKKSQYLLVWIGFFKDRFPPQLFTRKLIRFISEGFRTRSELREIALHTEEWIAILTEIHGKKWFNNLGKLSPTNQNKLVVK